MLRNNAQNPARLHQKLMRVVHSQAALKAAGVLLAALALVMVALQCGQWIAVHRLAARIHAADDSTAALLVAELAAFGDTAYPLLVVAANSNRSALALSARAQIDHLIDRWKRTAYLHPATFDLGSHALPLAQGLEKEIPSMTPSGRRWARRVLTSLVALAEQQQFGDRLALITICDRALMAIPAVESLPPFEADVDYRLTLAPPPRKSIFDGIPIVEQPRSVDIVALPASQDDLDPESQLAVDNVPNSDTISTDPDEADQNADWNANNLLRAIPASPSIESGRVPAHATSSRLAPPPMALDGNQQDLDVQHVPSLNDHVLERLFHLLATGDQEKQLAAADALFVRGYGHVTPLDARMLTSASPADRLALVDQLMTSPRLEARKWLWRLAHDPSGEVRAAAVASICTSGDKQLIAATLKLALADSDPRVAQHYSTLQKRLK